MVGLDPLATIFQQKAMALAKDVGLIENTQWRQRLEDWFSHHNRPMAHSNLKQALLPDTAIMIDNPVGTACGFAVKLNRAWLFFTPGVPFEFKQMVTDQFIPFINNKFDFNESSGIEKDAHAWARRVQPG